MIKLTEVESAESAPESQAKKSAFVFPNPYTLEVYQGLRISCPEEIQRLITEATAEAETDSETGDASDVLEAKIEDWIGENVPLFVSRWGVYGELLDLALEQVDFSTVARACLEDIQVP